MKKENVIFLSNATGGIRTFQNNLIKFFNKKGPIDFNRF